MIHFPTDISALRRQSLRPRKTAGRAHQGTQSSTMSPSVWLSRRSFRIEEFLGRPIPKWTVRLVVGADLLLAAYALWLTWGAL